MLCFYFKIDKPNITFFKLIEEMTHSVQNEAVKFNLPKFSSFQTGSVHSISIQRV